jgi:hypothetical protein
MSWSLELHAPGEAEGAPGWLEELSAFRGRELYAGGRRPAFRLGEDRYRDDDPHDRFAYHLLARCTRTGALVGCMRFMPVEGAPPCQVEAVLGRERTDIALQAIGARRSSLMEAARWIVRGDFQGKGIGIRAPGQAWVRRM